MEGSGGDMLLKNRVTPPGIDPGTVRLVAQRLNHYAIPGPTATATTTNKITTITATSSAAISVDY
jgi:formate-dependent phosphoribosylglycinamide formyltransferase (GAR transformylase)